MGYLYAISLYSNLLTGFLRVSFIQGNSVLEVIEAFEKVSNQKLAYKIVARREGDVTMAYANTDKANTVLCWKTESSLEEAIGSAWKWEQKIRS